MAKSKKAPNEQKAETPKKANKTTVPAAEVKEVKKAIDPNALLVVGGVQMLWKSRTFIPGIGHVSGKVYLVDYNTFCDQVKHLETDPAKWVSSVDEVAKEKKARQKEAKIRNGLS